MSDTLMQLYAKPAVSILVQQSQNQQFVTNFLCQASHADGSDPIDDFRQTQKKMAKYMFGVYQKMKLSIEAFLLALQIMETPEFRGLVQGDLEKHKFFQQGSPFQSVNRLKAELMERGEKNSQQKITFLLINIYAIGLLYLCHKVCDNFMEVSASNVWVHELGLETIAIEDIKQAEGRIAVSLNFDIFRPTVLTLLSVLMEQMGIRKVEFSHFVGYLLEAYMNTSMGKFVGGRNRMKRVNLVLGAVNLGCHFLCPRSWDERVLVGFNFGLEGVEKYSRILFGLFMDKENNIAIHEKYRTSRYKEVARIKIVSSVSSSERALRESTESENQEESSGSERDSRKECFQKRQKQFRTEKLMEVAC